MTLKNLLRNLNSRLQHSVTTTSKSSSISVDGTTISVSGGGTVIVNGVVVTGDGVVGGNSITGSGELGSEYRKLEPFYKVRCNLSGAVEIAVAEPEKLPPQPENNSPYRGVDIPEHADSHWVQIEGDDNLLSKVLSTVKEGCLILEMDKGLFHMATRLKISVGTTVLANVSNTGSANMIVSGVDNPTFDMRSYGTGDLSVSGTTKDLTCSSSGSGDLSFIGLDAQEVSIMSSGTGDILLQGNTWKVHANCSGTGDAYLSNLVVDQRASLRSSGTGDIWVDAKSVQGSFSGTGDLLLKKEKSAVDCDLKMSGTGRVRYDCAGRSF